ncbi:EamA family transporter RarD [Eggerthellaceae bacterium zg-997]|nr:EamA family transporter RarD [Eggerthellaceae bacterium zg-997]
MADGSVMEADSAARERRGILAALSCYVIWGVLPLYWKMLDSVNSYEVIAFRMVFCFALMVILCKVMRLNFAELLRERRAWRYLIPSAIMCGFGWSLYIIMVNDGQVVQASLGYYINPLVSVLLGMVMFRERLSAMQGIAVVLCAVGIAYFTISQGELPVAALALAVSFAIYGALRKRAGYAPIPAQTVECLFMLPGAVVAGAVALQVEGHLAFASNLSTPYGWAVVGLMLGSGVVTAVPLILFSKAANDIPLGLLGLIQYVSPTLSLMLGVFLFGEVFTLAHAVCLGCIWVGLVFVAFDAIRVSRGFELR